MDYLTIEKNEDETGLIKTSRYLALVSFIIGTLILTLFYLTEDSLIALMGFFYLVFVSITNSIFLVGLIYKLILKESNKNQILISIGIMLINIPIAIVYYKIAMHILATTMD